MNEKREKVKSYLRGIRQSKKRIEYKSAEIIRLRETAQSVRNTLPSGSSSRDGGDSLGQIIAKLLDMEKEYRVDVENCLDAEKEAVAFLDRISPDRANVLYLYWFEGLTWERIAETIHYSCQWTFTIGCFALDELYEVLHSEGKI